MTTRRLQPAYTHANRHTIAVIGDSIVRNYSLGVWTSQFWPEQLALLLRAAGAYVKARNLGSSGNTTTQMLARIYALVENDVPDIAFIAGGVNDPGNAISSATTTANILAMITYLKNAGVSRIVVMSAHYLNFSSGGDTLEVPYSPYEAIRVAQQDAVTAAADPNVVFCDVYNYMRNLIVVGTEVQGSGSWHVTPTNQHPNAHGGVVIASAARATVVAQPGWLAALST
jgi:lysophospholipase L1-like esterase